MTLEDINYIAQIVGVVAIFGTFAAVLFQIRQTNRLLRNQAKRAQIAELRSLSDTGTRGCSRAAIGSGLPR